jgi:hypothetical protein
MSRWNEDTPAFKIIKILTDLRKSSPAISKGEYETVYADQDVLVFERRYQQDVVLVAVNRGPATSVAIRRRVGLAPGSYRGVLANASGVNQGNALVVTQRDATLSLGALSSLVVSSQRENARSTAVAGAVQRSLPPFHRNGLFTKSVLGTRAEVRADAARAAMPARASATRGSYGGRMPPRYQIVDLGTLDGLAQSEALAVNQLGQVVGDACGGQIAGRVLPCEAGHERRRR